MYIKPTDKHQYLYHTSCHPRMCKESIPYAQALTLRRICSRLDWFIYRAADLCRFFVARGYKKAFSLKQIRRARLRTREETLAPHPRNAANRVPMVLTYHPSLPNIGSILRELQPLLHCSEKCRKAIKDVPFIAFQRSKSLGDYLVHAKLRLSTRLERSSKGTVVCGNRRCQVCKYLEQGERFTSYRTGKSYTINYELDCNNSNVVYLLSCKVCHAQYVGSTTTKFRLRFNNHKARFRAHSRLSFEGRNKDDLLYRHFFGPGHHGLEDVSIQLIDRVSGEESALRDKEGQWAYRLNCIQPQGLNISDFFYSQNRSTRSRVR